MKIVLYCFGYVLITLCSHTLAQSGEETEVGEETQMGMETQVPDGCFFGALTNGIGETFIRECAFDKGMGCQTRIETRIPLIGQENFTSVVRECTQLQACVNNGVKRIPECIPGINDVRVCFECCNTPLCNRNTELPEVTFE